MKVYKFLPLSYGESSVRNKELKISTFDSLNDPFELSAINHRDPKIKNFNQSARDYICKKYGLISFSRDYRSPLMWGHYADTHTGVCLGFDVTDTFLHKVRYQRDRLKFDFKSRLNSQDVINLISVKFSEWRYEAESRVLVHLSDAQEKNGMYFESFSNSMQLTEILLGLNCPVDPGFFEEIIRRNYVGIAPIHVKKLNLAKTKFGLTKTIHKP